MSWSGADAREYSSLSCKRSALVSVVALVAPPLRYETGIVLPSCQVDSGAAVGCWKGLRWERSGIFRQWVADRTSRRSVLAILYLLSRRTFVGEMSRISKVTVKFSFVYKIVVDRYLVYLDIECL